MHKRKTNPLTDNWCGVWWPASLFHLFLHCFFSFLTLNIHLQWVSRMSADQTHLQGIGHPWTIVDNFPRCCTMGLNPRPWSLQNNIHKYKPCLLKFFRLTLCDFTRHLLQMFVLWGKPTLNGFLFWIIVLFIHWVKRNEEWAVPKTFAAPLSPTASEAGWWLPKVVSVLGRLSHLCEAYWKQEGWTEQEQKEMRVARESGKNGMIPFISQKPRALY